ncbi:MAG TPA: chemotaxis protein CheW [Limnochordia bacterium]|nr:chemotaxis protein CheW [Limnochordia bacterium]
MSEKEVAGSLESSQCVVFSLGDEWYGVDIFQVREIIRVPPVTKIPGAPYWAEGVINLRGGVIPVLDLRKRFGMPPGPEDADRRIVVVELGDQTIGIVVDGVSEVLEIEAGAIEPPSPFVVPSGSGAVWGIAKVSDRLIILLDLDAVLSGEEKERLKAMADAGSSQANGEGAGAQ